jgi:MFS family permease
MLSPDNRPRARLRAVAGRYREARQSLRTPTSVQSRRGLDWTNFFVADVQTGFGTFVAFYLAHLGWSQSNVGLALAVGTIAGVLSQIPGGALADAIKWKRGLVALGIVMVGTAALILAASSRQPLPPLVSAWSAARRCRCEPGETIAFPQAATRSPPA